MELQGGDGAPGMQWSLRDAMESQECDEALSMLWSCRVVMELRGCDEALSCGRGRGGLPGCARPCCVRDSRAAVPPGVRVSAAGQCSAGQGSAGSTRGQHSSSAMSRMLPSSAVKVGRSSGFCGVRGEPGWSPCLPQPRPGEPCHPAGVAGGVSGGESHAPRASSCT